jgi:TonB family protein
MIMDVRTLTEGQHFLVFLLVLVALSFVCMAVMAALRVARRGAARFWMGPALIALALMPAVVSVGLAALAFRSVLEGMSLVGTGGVAAVAAGSAESMIPLLVGLTCTAGLTLLALLLVTVGSSKVEESAAESGLTLGTFTAPLAVLLTFGLFALLASLINRVNFGALEPASILQWWRGSAFGAAGLAVFLVLFAALSAFGAPRGRAPLAVKIVAVLSLLLAGLGTLVTPALLYSRMDRLATTALTGQTASTTETREFDVPGAVPPPLTGLESSAPEASPSPEIEATPEALAPSAPASARTRPSPRATPAPVEEEQTEDSPVEPPPTPKALRVGAGISEPKKVRNVNPRYPEIAKQARVQGVVILECTIDSRGDVSDIKVLRSIPLLDAAAVEAVKQWRYEPTILNGVAVPLIMTVTVNFRLS